MGCTSSKPKSTREVPIGGVDRYRPPRKSQRQPPSSLPTAIEESVQPNSERPEGVPADVDDESKKIITETEVTPAIIAEPVVPNTEGPEGVPADVDDDSKKSLTETEVTPAIFAEPVVPNTEGPEGVSAENVGDDSKKILTETTKVAPAVIEEPVDLSTDGPGDAESSAEAHTTNSATHTELDDHDTQSRNGGETPVNAEAEETAATSGPEVELMKEAALSGQVILCDPVEMTAERDESPEEASPISPPRQKSAQNSPGSTPRKLMAIKSSKKILDYEEGVNRTREDEKQRVQMIRENTLRNFGIVVMDRGATAPAGRGEGELGKKVQYESAVSQIPVEERQRAKLIRANTLKTFGISEDESQVEGGKPTPKKRASISELAKAFEGGHGDTDRRSVIQTRNSC